MTSSAVVAWISRCIGGHCVDFLANLVGLKMDFAKSVEDSFKMVILGTQVLVD